MKRLLNNQAIFIDDHKRCVSHANFDDPSADIHLDKKSKDGLYRIKVPLNSDKPIQVSVKGNRGQTIPKDLKREIQDAFSDEKKRKGFVKELVDILKNYPYTDVNKEFDSDGVPQKAFNALKQISKHFDLEWSEDTVKGYLKRYKYYGVRYITTITNGADMYYFSCDNQQIIAADYKMAPLKDVQQWEIISPKVLFPE